MSASWGWTPQRPEGIWRHGCRWMRPLFAAAPWATLALLAALFALVEGRLTAAPGLGLELPAGTCDEGELPDLAAVVMPVVREGAAASETLVYFDDARYSHADPASGEALRERLGERAAGEGAGVLLLLVDERVASGDLMKLTALAREAGVARVQIAERRE